MIWRAACLYLMLAGCNAPDSDPGDLLGVFEPRASASGSASAAPPLAKAKPDATDDGPKIHAREREPITGPCVAPSGSPAPLTKRPAGRPGCRRARVLEDRDPNDVPRYGCVFAPPDLDERKPLPLLVFLHGDLDDPRAVHQKTGLQNRYRSFDLTGDSQHQGFVILAPQARRILIGKAKFSQTERWDVDYTGADSADAKAIDRFVDRLIAEGAVDARQIYAVGHGRGGAMAQLYAMLRPDRVAAVGLYAAAPRLDWTCSAEPPPAALIYRACDTVLPCADAEQWLRAREEAHRPTFSLRLGAANASEPSCVLTAARCKEKAGIANHHRWPKSREEDLLEYLGRFSLRTSP